MNRRTFGGLSGTVLLAGLVLALIINPFNLPIFFIGVGASIFIGALASPNPNALYGALFGTLWMLILALFFITGFWQWFLIGGVLSAVLGTFGRPIIASLMGSNLYGAYNQNNRPPGGFYQPRQPYYQPPQQPNQQSYQPYQQGYQPPAPGEAYQEGNQQYRYPAQGQEYEQPQPQYPPQEMPPQ